MQFDQSVCSVLQHRYFMCKFYDLYLQQFTVVQVEMVTVLIDSLMSNLLSLVKKLEIVLISD